MQTIVHDFLSVPSRTVKTGTGRRSIRTIVLLASLALVMSACKTTDTLVETNADRQTSTQAHLEPKEAAQAQELLDKGQTLIRQGKTQEALVVLDELDRRFGLDTRRPVRTILAQALSLRAQAAATPTESLAIQIEIGRRYKDVDPALRKQLVTAMFDQAAALGKEGNLLAAIPVYKEIEQTYGEGEGNDKSWGAWAIFYQGGLQRQLRNHKAAVAAYERLDRRFGQESDPTIRAVVADALFKKGEALTEQGNTRAAIAAYEEIDRRYAGDHDASFRLRAVRALFALGALLGKQSMGEEPGSDIPSASAKSSVDTVAAVAVYDEIIQRFGRDKDQSIRNLVGGALLKKSEALRLSGDDQGTIAVYGEIVERFGNDNAQVSRVLVATALFRKGLALGKLEGASPSAIAAFDEVARRFASDTHQSVRKIVEQSIRAKQKLIAETAPPHDN